MLLARARLIRQRARFLGGRPVSQWIQVPVIFGGLLVTLWTWKSLMLVLFQNKIIYMPYLGRHEEIKDYATPNVKWHRHTISANRVTLALCQSQLICPPTSAKSQREQRNTSRRRRELVTIIYLQGNASSTPPRLPHLSKVLTELCRRDRERDYVIWTVAYRGYWQSTGRPSERGLQLDVKSAVSYILSLNHRSDDDEPKTLVKPIESQKSVDPRVILWGHSIGASLAMSVLPHLGTLLPTNASIRVILETPFSDTSAVLKSLYPQKWLPYRYLSPFLQSKLSIPDSLSHLDPCTRAAMAPQDETRVESMRRKLKFLVLKAELDEIVDSTTTDVVISALHARRLDTSCVVVPRALHQDCFTRPLGRSAIVDFILRP